MPTHRALTTIFVLALSALQSSCGFVGASRKYSPERHFKDPKVIQMVHAAMDGKVEEIEELVRTGADINLVGKEGVTPLMLVVAMGNELGCKELLRLGADPNTKDDKGRSSVVIAAMLHKSPTVIGELLAGGGDPNSHNANDSDYEWPLLCGISNRSPDVVKELLNAGADPNAQNKEGSRPLDYAAMCCWECVCALLQAGADPSLPVSPKFGHRGDLATMLRPYGQTIKEEGLDERRKWFEKVIRILDEFDERKAAQFLSVP